LKVDEKGYLLFQSLSSIQSCCEAVKNGRMQGTCRRSFFNSSPE